MYLMLKKATQAFYAKSDVCLSSFIVKNEIRVTKLVKVLQMRTANILGS